MVNLNERVAVLEEIVSEQSKEIDSLREAKHKHSNEIQKSKGEKEVTAAILKRVVESVDKLEKTVNKIVWLSAGGMAVGAFLIGIILYVAKDIMKLW